MPMHHVDHSMTCAGSPAAALPGSFGCSSVASDCCWLLCCTALCLAVLCCAVGVLRDHDLEGMTDGFDAATAYGQIEGFEDPSMGWSRSGPNLATHIARFCPIWHDARS
jgi:hypothetical protein